MTLQSLNTSDKKLPLKLINGVQMLFEPEHTNFIAKTMMKIFHKFNKTHIPAVVCQLNPPINIFLQKEKKFIKKANKPVTYFTPKLIET